MCNLKPHMKNTDEKAIRKRKPVAYHVDVENTEHAE